MREGGRERERENEGGRERERLREREGEAIYFNASLIFFLILCRV